MASRSPRRGSALWRGIALSVTALLLAWPVSTRASGAAAHTAGRVVAVGDIHGDFDSFVAILQRAGLIDDTGGWIGGTATLVQTGDFTDRGANVRDVMDLLIALEQQATAAGGRVVVLLGNHEVMNLLRDVRDVTPAIYASFADASSDERREQGYRAYARPTASRDAALRLTLPVQSRDEWMRAHPPGFLEYADAFGPEGRYGRWLRSKSVATKLGDTVFLHAGIDPTTTRGSLREINDRVRRELDTFDELRAYMISRKLVLPFSTLGEILEAAAHELERRQTRASDTPRERERLEAMPSVGSWDVLRPDGPLWFRGFATWSSSQAASLVDNLLDRYHAAHFVVGHTVPSTMRITPRFGSRVFLIDTGMLTSVYPGGRASALEIHDGRFAAIYEDQQVTLVAPAAASESIERNPEAR